MHSLLLFAAISSQITFATSQQGEVYTITPQVIVTQDCVCQVQIIAEREGAAGVSRSRQRNTITLAANQPATLSHLSLNISPKDKVKVVVTVSDGKSLHLAQQWPTEQITSR
ncbi:curli assembly chaperone CsgC [Salmonella enterica]